MVLKQDSEKQLDDFGKKEYDFSKIEKKWQKVWESKKTFEVKEDKNKPSFYALEMYPYPSGSGLHMGHAFNYTLCDILARFKLMQGFNVLHPAGYDSFGLPAENAAIKAKSHPRVFTDSAISNFVKQQKQLGFSYDWSRKLQSHDVEYYKWNQFWFLQFYEKGLVYRKESPVNWCPKCETVLANEQVHNGKCWRHSDTNIEIKQLEQWFIRTSKYCEELLSGLEDLDWPERIKVMQRNWIGKSEGAEIVFKVNGENWNVFTTRPDTLFGVTFLVVSAQHSKLNSLVTKENKKAVDSFVKKLISTKQEDLDKLDKEGVFTGSYAIHPLTGEKIPIWAGNFVVADYGSGMVMAVPAHDQRDYDFAKKYKLPVKLVIEPSDGKLAKLNEAYTGSGVLCSSAGFSGLTSDEAKEHIVIALKEKKLGSKKITYKLRDWLVSRQRYWGTPIPMIHCEKCGIVPVDEKELPVKLPEDIKFGEGNPIATSKSFVNVKCGKCNGKARRETDTMDTFFDSSWYYLRFCDATNSKKPFDKDKVNYWMPVNFYTGGAEHACMHLIYARFFTKALRDLGYLKFDEPFLRLFNQGMVHAEDGAVMSKSLGNVIDPTEISNKYGADALRFFLVSMALPDKDFDWSPTGLESNARYLSKIYSTINNVKIGKSSDKFQHKLNKVLKLVTQDIENIKYNFAIIKIRELIDNFEEQVSLEDLKKVIQIIAPFCPHVAEELWEVKGCKGLVTSSKWPDVDESKINDKFDEVEKAIDKTVADIINVLKIVQEKSGSAEKVYLYVLPKEFEQYDAESLSKRVGKEVIVYRVNDSKKHDPTGKAGKTKPGKPAIYIE